MFSCREYLIFICSRTEAILWSLTLSTQNLGEILPWLVSITSEATVALTATRYFHVFMPSVSVNVTSTSMDLWLSFVCTGREANTWLVLVTHLSRIFILPFLYTCMLKLILRLDTSFRPDGLSNGVPYTSFLKMPTLCDKNYSQCTDLFLHACIGFFWGSAQVL